MLTLFALILYGYWCIVADQKQGKVMSADEKARFSARDSLACKYSAFRLKYFADPYIEKVYLALNNLAGTAPVRRSPIIHRGYHTRYECFTKVLNMFLEKTAGGARQVVFLGAGFDTLPLVPYTVNQHTPGLRTFEIDFQDVTNKKAEVFRSIPGIVELLSTGEVQPMISPKYKRMGSHTFIGEDMRDAKRVVSALMECGLDNSVPTLVLSECVLVYMGKEHTVNLCRELAQYLQADAVWMTYDMISPEDIYGRSMIRNLHAAGFEIPGIEDFPTLDDQKNRFLETGWDAAHSCTMRHYYDKILPAECKDRVSKLEILDEVEELNLLMDHYSVTIATKGTGVFEDILNVVPP
jgi:tRNA wybutosine-synthesizing protein 4